jgi:hypothetical protein
MAVDKKRIYELIDQPTITDTDVSSIDKSGNLSAKKYTFLNLWNYIKSKIVASAVVNSASGHYTVVVSGEQRVAVKKQLSECLRKLKFFLLNHSPADSIVSGMNHKETE